MTNYTTTILASLQTTITTISPIITNFSNLSNYTSQNSEAANNNNNNQQPDPATLATPYIALIISVIGLFSTIIVHYNIKKIKVCCIKFECVKNKNIKHNKTDSDSDNDNDNNNDDIYDNNFENIQTHYLETHHPHKETHQIQQETHHHHQDNSENNNEKIINDIFIETIV